MKTIHSQRYVLLLSLGAVLLSGAPASADHVECWQACYGDDSTPADDNQIGNTNYRYQQRNLNADMKKGATHGDCKKACEKMNDDSAGGDATNNMMKQYQGSYGSGSGS